MRVACIRMVAVLGVLTISLFTADQSQSSESVAAGCPAGSEVRIHNGFMTGAEFLEQPEGYQRGYAAGFLNGLLISPFAGGSERCVSHYGQCLESTTDAQLAAVIRRWLNENPERWHEGSHIASWLAIRRMCE